MNVSEVKKNINSIYDRRRVAVYALCLQYSAIALNYFRSVQPARPGEKGKFWTNRTGIAALTVFSGAEQRDNIISWFMSHAVQYGTYLELSNDRAHESLRPIIERYLVRFYKDIKNLYGY